LQHLRGLTRPQLRTGPAAVGARQMSGECRCVCPADVVERLVGGKTLLRTALVDA